MGEKIGVNLDLTAHAVGPTGQPQNPRPVRPHLNLRPHLKPEHNGGTDVGDCSGPRGDGLSYRSGGGGGGVACRLWCTVLVCS